MTDIELTDNALNRSEVNSKKAAYQNDKRTQHTHVLEEHLYLQDAARIPYSGMQQVLYPDLTMTIALGRQERRDSAYRDNFKNGLAQWYHLPQDTFLKKYKQHIVNEIRYLALAMTSDQDSHSKHIAMIWPIKSVILSPRHKINKEQAGKDSKSDLPYYLFELGKPLTLKDAIYNVPHRPFKNSMKLTTLTHLQETSVFSALGHVYEDALV
jgi:hypothetical protein